MHRQSWTRSEAPPGARVAPVTSNWNGRSRYLTTSQIKGFCLWSVRFSWETEGALTSSLEGLDRLNTELSKGRRCRDILWTCLPVPDDQLDRIFVRRQWPTVESPVLRRPAFKEMKRVCPPSLYRTLWNSTKVPIVPSPDGYFLPLMITITAGDSLDRGTVSLTDFIQRTQPS